MIDQPKPIRGGEEINLEQLRAYLKKVEPDWPQSIETQQFPSGFSNLTYWVKIGEQEMVLRRPPHGASAKGGHDMHREFNVLQKIRPVFGKVPQVFHYCADENVIGAPFYLMERVQGVILRPNAHGSFPAISPTEFQTASNALIDTLVELHGADYDAAGLGDFGRPAGYTERQVKGWTKRYAAAKTDAVQEIESVIKWLNERIPAHSGATIIHNDFKYDNVVFQPGDWSKIIAVLDWEMATLGDPLMDLGTTLAYWVTAEDPASEQKMTSILSYLPGNPNRTELLALYAQKSGREIGDFMFYYVFGLFKIAVIVQQIYFRYAKGYTTDPRFAKLNEMAKYCCSKGLLAIQKQRLDNLF